MDKQIIHTRNAPLPIGPYNQAVRANGMLFVSGQIALNPESGKLEMENIEVETTRVMQNLEAVLKEADMDFRNVVKSSIFLKDMNNFQKINEIYSRYFSDEKTAPARETVEVARLPKDVNVEISLVAVAN